MHCFHGCSEFAACIGTARGLLWAGFLIYTFHYFHFLALDRKQKFWLIDKLFRLYSWSENVGSSHLDPLADKRFIVVVLRVIYSLLQRAWVLIHKEVIDQWFERFDDRGGMNEKVELWVVLVVYELGARRVHLIIILWAIYNLSVSD